MGWGGFLDERCGDLLGKVPTETDVAAHSREEVEAVHILVAARV